MKEHLSFRLLSWCFSCSVFQTFDECVSAGGSDCAPEKLWLQIPFFCGHYSECWWEFKHLLLLLCRIQTTLSLRLSNVSPFFRHLHVDRRDLVILQPKTGMRCALCVLKKFFLKMSKADKMRTKEEVADLKKLQQRVKYPKVMSGFHVASLLLAISGWIN